MLSYLTSKRRSCRLFVATLGVLVICPIPAFGAPAAAQPPGSPGGPAYWGVGRKDGVGSAFSRASNVWYTLANGRLTEVFYPHTDTPDVSSLSFIVTDGRHFADHQDVAMRSITTHADPQSPVYEVTSTDHRSRYRLVADYLSDPARPTVLIHLRLLGFDSAARAPYRLYLRYNPTPNGDGSRNFGLVAGAALLAQNSHGHYSHIVASALLASPPLREGSVAYADRPGDPALALPATFGLPPAYSAVGPGNIVQGARIALRADGSADLALAFGPSLTSAQATAAASLTVPYSALATTFADGWHRYAATLTPPSQQFSRGQSDEFYAAAVALKASEDKGFPGAIVAALTFPWGQVARTYAGKGYHLVWARDLYEIASGLAAAGDTSTARDAARYLLHTVETADGAMPQTSLVDGTPSSGASQLDELAFPLILAWQTGIDDSSTYATYLRPLADYLVRHGPSTGQERWEEDSGYSPSTIAAEIAGLVAAGASAERNGDPDRALVYRAVADSWQRGVKRWTVTSTGALAHHPYFIRIDDDTNPNDGSPVKISGGPTQDERNVVDAGFLELVRFGELAPTDPDVVQSLPVIDATLRAQTPFGPGWHRYNGDTYGDGVHGTPWNLNNRGIGGVWPVFNGERGEYELSLGHADAALGYLEQMRRFATPTGLIPEQVWDAPTVPPSPIGTPLDQASIGMAPGQASGSATPLNWSMAQYLRLLADVQVGSLIEQPSITHDRYVSHPVAAAKLSVENPAGDLKGVGGKGLKVAGQAAPGSTVVIMVSGTSTTAIRPTMAADGSFSATVPIVDASVSLISIAAHDVSGGTALVLRRLNA